MDPIPTTSRDDTLKYFHQRAQDEIDFLRESQNKIFTWSSNILLLIIGALLVIDSSKSLAWTAQGVFGKIIASGAVVVLSAFSMIWQQRLRHWQEESIEVRYELQKLLHCYDKGYFGTDEDVAIYPDRWAVRRDYHKRIGFWKRLIRVNYVSATFMLSMLAIAMIWFASY